LIFFIKERQLNNQEAVQRIRIKQTDGNMIFVDAVTVAQIVVWLFFAIDAMITWRQRLLVSCQFQIKSCKN
jgi:hypothetical protein